MSELLDKIIEAKGVLGDRQAEIIAEGYPLEEWNPEKGSAKSIFNANDNNPSMMWMKKDYYFKDFSTGKVFGILDYYMYKFGEPYMKAVKRLLDETKVKYDPSLFSFTAPTEQKDYFKNFRYPKVENDISGVALEYMAKRGISEETCRYVGLGSDAHGNVAYQFRDLTGRVVTVKYRPSHAIKSGEPKYFYQKNADTCPILYNINKIDVTQPLLLTEGMNDTMACIEAGFKNVVSIPSGANDDNWINFNYEFLDQFEDIILWFDNDDAGESGMKKAIPRLGEYRIKIVKPTEDDEEAVCNYYHSFSENVNIRKTDANNVLLACGGARVLALINSAEEIPMESVIDLMDVEEFDIEQTEYIPSGINSLDRQIYGFIDGTLNIWTAYSGCVDCDTEFFDGTKWKRIADFQNGDKVLQYNDDGTAELVTPSVFHKYKCDYLWHFKTKYGINQCLSEEHNVYYLNQDGKLMSLPFAEVKRRHESNKEGFTGRFIKAFNYGGVGIDLSDAEIKLMCAVICDGTFTHNKTNLCRFHLKKDRKKVEVRKIFSECGIEYTERESAASGYTDFYFYAPRREKEFTDYWYDCSHEQLKVVCDNIMFWDGSVDNIGRMKFSTSIKATADFVQFAYTSCGYRATIRVNDRSGQKYFTCGKWYTRKSCEYCVGVSTRTTASMSCSSAENKAKIEKYETKDGFKYCFTVPSHKWIMRRGNDIVVTGNCGKTTMISQTVVLEAIDKGNTVFWFNAESTTSQMLNWVLAQAAGRQHSVEYTGANGFQFYKPTPQATQAIKQYYAKKIFVYDNLLLSNPDMVFNKMKEVYKRFGTKVFVLDNWLCLNFRGISDTEVTGIQVDFMNKLIHFTKQNGLEVHLVCHPRKQQAGIPLSEYEILGTSNIVNMADRIYGLEKVWDNDLKAQGYDRQFTVFKDRTLGIHGERIGLRYDRVTRRLYGDGDDKFKQYSWDKGLIRYNTPIFGKNGLLVGDRVLDYEQAAANNTPY